MERYQRGIHTLLITFVWALALYGVHRFFEQPAQGASPVLPTGVHVTMRLPHLCCSGCYDSAVRAVGKLRWLSEPKLLRTDLPTQDQAAQGVTSVGVGEEHPHQTDYSGKIAIGLKSDRLAVADFAELDQMLRKEGLVPNQMILTGIRHFQLVAHLPHLCCQLCGMAVREALSPRKIEVAEASQTVTADFQASADVALFLRTLENAGFAPDSVKLVILPS
jgi:hypothetical protein